MPKINVLSKQLAELIAAGEVVERPASVIKELLENAVDAGATNINVEIKNGGISYIRITDNGCGIAREDIRNAFVSHATSKIASVDDLSAIMTLGFRGEALASIAAVARVEVLTKTADEAIGTRYVIESGEEVLLDDAGCPTGTTIVVRDLFYSTPARMKFLKKDVSEANAVAGVVDRIALSHPEISFRFIREGKQTLITSGNGDLLVVAREIFGKEFAQALIPAESSVDGVKVTGFISKPAAARPNRNMQFFFVNDRLVKTGTGGAAISEAYKNTVMVGKFPSCILNISVDPHKVDVNVHPAKIEVRFSDEKAIFNAVYYACKNALSVGDTRVQMKTAPARDVFTAKPVVAEQTKMSTFTRMSVDEYKQEQTKVTSDFSRPFSEVKKAPVSFSAPKETDFSVNDTPDLLPEIKPQVKVIEKTVVTPVEVSVEKAAPIPEKAPVTSVTVTPVTISVEKIKESEKSAETVPAVHNDVSFEDFRLIGEAFKSYIIVELGGKLLFIDKHAAHERMIYEQLKANEGDRSGQLLLVPVTVTLTKEEYSAVLDNTELFEKGGFCVEDFGTGTVAVSECPMEITPDDVEDIICEIAGRLLEKSKELMYEKLDWIYHSVACRSAIKAGDYTTREEMEKFAKQLLSMPDIRYCPHGRPVLIEMTQRELEKNFGRV